MAQKNQEWEALGRNIQEIVDKAVSAADYQKLNQTIRQAVDVGAEAVRKAVDTARTGERKPDQTTDARQGQVLTQKQAARLYGNTNGRTAGAIVKIVGGGMLTAVGAVLLLGSLVLEAMVGLEATLISPIAVSLVGLVSGGGLLTSGIANVNRIGRFKKYCRTLGQKTYCTLEKLARSVGKPEKYVRKELLKMTGQGLFLEGHLDHEGKHFIVSDDTYRSFEQSRLQLMQQRSAAEADEKAKDSRSPQVREVLERGETYLAQIRRCNDAIPGVVISEKISRIELLVQKIFHRAEEHPEVIPDLKKMMDYYLPMTVKLLNAYAEMDAQPVQGETILSAKQEIEATLDTLNRAFEKLLDTLFADTALDVSSDISVLNTLLAQEGLTEDELQKARKGG